MEKGKITARCPIRTTLELLGGKWKLLILYQLKGETLRFSELRQRIPDISEKMLVQELKTMADQQLVARDNHGTVPPRVEYSLTELGAAAMPVLEAMAYFGHTYQASLGLSA